MSSHILHLLGPTWLIERRCAVPQKAVNTQARNPQATAYGYLITG